MIANRKEIFDAWETFQQVSGGIRRPVSEADYVELLELIDELTSRYNCNQEPYASLFDIIATYMHEWELDNEPELKLMHLEPSQRLAFIMERRGISQYQLAQEGLVDQGNLSKILKGDLGISKALAKRLAKRFGVGVELFI